MTEIEDLLNELDGPPPPDRIIPIPPPRRYPIVLAGVALSVAATILVWIPARHWSGTRGPSGEVEVDLRMIVERDGAAYRVSPEGVYHTGETVYFRVAAMKPEELLLRVDTPEGSEEIARIVASPNPEDVRENGDLVGWRFETPGRYRFILSALAVGSAECLPGVCQQVVLEVQ